LSAVGEGKKKRLLAGEEEEPFQESVIVSLSEDEMRYILICPSLYANLAIIRRKLGTKIL